jgi:hypothetical protein
MLDDPIWIARGQLFGALLDGKLEPDKAEALALSQGLEPLNPHPPKSDFDVLAESHWTLPMTLAWIMWRDPEVVVEEFGPYREATPHWASYRFAQPDTRELMIGFRLAPNGPATVRKIAICDIVEHIKKRSTLTQALDFEAAKAELWRACLDGQLQAEGIDADSDRLVAIPAREWRLLDTTEVRNVELLAIEGVNNARYRDVVFRRQDIVARWPPPRARLLKSQKASARFRAVLVDAMIAARDNPQRNADWGKIARDHFGLSRVAFRGLWSEAINQASAPKWRMAGSGRNPAVFNPAEK